MHVQVIAGCGLNLDANQFFMERTRAIHITERRGLLAGAIEGFKQGDTQCMCVDPASDALFDRALDVPAEDAAAAWGCVLFPFLLFLFFFVCRLFSLHFLYSFVCFPFRLT